MTWKDALFWILYAIYSITWFGYSTDYIHGWRILVDKFAVTHGIATGIVNFMPPHDLDYMIGADYHTGGWLALFISIKLLIFAAGFVLPIILPLFICDRICKYTVK